MSAAALRLPDAGRVDPWLRSPLGPAITAPWTEPLLLHVVTRWYFPLSRLWAAAEIDDPWLDRFRTNPAATRRVAQAVLRIAAAKAAAERGTHGGTIAARTC